MAVTMARWSASLRQLNSHGSANNDMLTTSRWWSPAQIIASTTSWVKKKPFALPALSPTMVASGATPVVPIPLIGEAASLAMWVPCPLRSWTAALFEQSPLATSAGSALGLAEVMNRRQANLEVGRYVGVGKVDPGIHDAEHGPGYASRPTWSREEFRAPRTSARAAGASGGDG